MPYPEDGDRTLPREPRLLYESGSTRVFRTQPQPEDVAEGLLRVLDPQALPADRERHVREFLLFRRSDHPHWPDSAAYRFTGEGPTIYLANVPGIPLSECSFGPGWDSEKREICRQLLSALDELHRAGRTHGRLAAEHAILYLPDQQQANGPPHVTLVDLGTAAPAQSTGRASRILIDPGPASGSDACSFAQILFQLITGSPAPSLRGDEVHAIRKKLPADLPRELRFLLADLFAQADDGPSMEAIWSSLRRIPATDASPGSTSAKGPGHDEEGLVVSNAFPFIGRDREIRRFLEWIQRVESAEDVTTFRCCVEGEPGVGRRALAQQLIAHAETRGWIPSGPEPDDSWSLVFPARPALFLSVQVEERGPDLEAVTLAALGAAFPTGVVPPSFILRAWPLPVHELETIARTRLRSQVLIERCAHISAGNPGLLEALLAGIEPFVDGVSREHPGSLHETEHERTLPPESWIAWAQALSNSLNPNLRRVLVTMAVAGNAWPTEIVEELIAPVSGTTGTLEDLARRGVLDLSARPAILSSALWESAWRRAEPELAREIALALLPTIPLHATGDLLAHACRLAIDLSLWNEVTLLLDRALVRLHEAGRHTSELRLLAHAIQHVPPVELHVRPERLLAIGRMFLWCDRSEASLLHSSFAEGRFPVTLPEHLEVALITWARLAQNDAKAAQEPFSMPTAEAVSIFPAASDPSTRHSSRPEQIPASWDLCSLWGFELVPVSLEWLFAFLSTRRPDSLREETVDWVLGLTAHPRFSKKLDRAHLGSAALRFCQIGSTVRRREILAEMIHHAGWPDGIRAGLVHLYQSETAHAEGRSFEARTEARSAEGIFRRFESWSHHLRVLQMLAALAYADGDLLLAHRHWRRSLQSSLEQKQWRTAVHVAHCLARCALARGDFSQAIAACQRVHELHDRFAVGSDEDSRVSDDELALCSGDLDALLTQEQRHDDPPWLRVRGLAELLAGHSVQGRASLELAFERTRPQNPERSAELLLDWLICETDLLQAQPALTLYNRLEELEPHLTAYGRARLLLAQGGLAARNWLFGGSNEEQVLLETAMLSHETDSGSTTWRAYWNLSLYYDRCAQPQFAEDRRKKARQCLEDVAGTLPQHRQPAYRALPGPRAVLMTTN